MKEIKGFSDGIPKRAKEQWLYEHNGRMFTFGKNRESPKHFIYYCRRDTDTGRFITASSTGFETDRDLTYEEVEQRQHFIDFMNATR
jgi:hypothetical protein